MLSDEEREAIEWLKLVSIVATNEYTMKQQTYLYILSKLIEKQSKEIEELKEDRYGLEEEVQIQAKNIMLCENALCEIQDKIKAKIEEYKKEQEFYNKNEDREWGQFNNWDWIDRIINEMHSLLEKE